MNLAQKLETYDNVSELKARLSGLKIKLQGLVEDNHSEVLKSELIRFYPLFEEYSKNNSLELYSSKAIDTLLLDLEKIQVLEIVLAFNPSSDFISRLLTWLSVNVTQDLVCNFLENRNIVSGAVLTFNGNYGDYSSRKRINSLFSKEQIKI